MRPKASVVFATICCTAASSVTSQGTTSARRPSFSISPLSASSGGTSRAASARSAPSRARVEADVVAHALGRAGDERDAICRAS